MQGSDVRPAQAGQESILDFLSASGVPVVSRLAAALRWVALTLALGSFGYAVLALVLWDDGFWSAARPWGGALPALIAAPSYFVAWRLAVSGRLHAAATALFVALFAVSALMSWPHGPFHPGWYAEPVLALLATCCLGITPGLLMTVLAVAALLCSPFGGVAVGAPDGEAVWQHTISLAAVVLASALTGALVHRLMLTALANAQTQRERERESRQALRYREKLLRHAMRVDTVGDLAGLVSHQLRNAFQVMMGHVTLGSSSDDPGEPAQRLALVGQTLDDTRPLLDQLMSLAHPEDGAPAAFDLDAYAAEFGAKVGRVMPSTVVVELVRAGRPMTVQVDPRGLEHAMWNLVINARQAMTDGGTLRITAGLDGGMASVAVGDTGPGIPPEVQRRVFDPYFTTKPPGTGTGLGLAAVDSFVRGCRGEVVLESEPGRGATFRLRFPLGAGDAQANAG